MTNYADLASLYEISTGLIWSTIEIPNFANVNALVTHPPDDTTLEAMVLSVLNGWLTMPMPEEASAVVLCKIAAQWFESDKLMDEWNEIIKKNTFDGWNHVSFLEQLDEILETTKRTDTETQVQSLRNTFIEYLTAFRQTVFYLLQGENVLADTSRIKANGHLIDAHSLLQSNADQYLSNPCEGSIGTSYTRLSD